MLTVKLQGFEEAIRSLDVKTVNQAARIAVREATTAARVEVSNLIRQKWNIKKRDLEAKFTVRAIGNGLTRELGIGGPPIGLAYFGAKEVKETKAGTLVKVRNAKGALVTRRQKRARATGLSVEIVKGRRTTVRHAWLAFVRKFAGRAKGGETLYGEHGTRVLARVGRNVIGPKSISVASMLHQDGIDDRVLERAGQTLQARFFHHLNRLG